MNNTFPNNRVFYNHPEGQSTARSRSGEVNGGRDGQHSLNIFGHGQLGPFQPYHNHSVDPAFLHGQGSYPSSAGASYRLQYPALLAAVPADPYRSHPQAGSFAGQVEGTTAPGYGRLSDQPNLRRLAPASHSLPHIERRRSSTRRRSHASSLVAGGSDPHPTIEFPSSAGVQGAQYNASPPLHGSRSRKGRHIGPRSSAPSTFVPTTSTSSHYHYYAGPDSPAEVGHAQSSLAPLFPLQPTGLQPGASQDRRCKLSTEEFASRSTLLRNEYWVQEQTEEPLITASDEFVKREYISIGTADMTKTRFSAFVAILPGTRRALCLIPHNVIVKGVSVPCRYEKANEKEALAHVASYFGYAGYKCQITDPRHRCNKRKGFSTWQRRNDHNSKAKKRPEPRVNCDICGKSTLERNMERHKIKCRAKIATTL